MTDLQVIVMMIVFVGFLLFIPLVIILREIVAMRSDIRNEQKALELFLRQLCLNTAPKIPTGKVPRPGGGSSTHKSPRSPDPVDSELESWIP